MQAARALFHRLALWVERVAERLTRRRRARDPLLEPYRGFSTPDRLILRGRVLTALRRTHPEPESSRWQNLKQMAGLFLTDEVAGVAAVAPSQGVQETSDPEGYLWIEVPRGEMGPGWHEVAVEIAGRPGTRTGFPVLVPAEDARLGVITDIDDTMMETGAYSLLRNLWTTFTGSALTRKVFPDSVVLIDHLSRHGRNPVYYVSSSPWNLHAFLDKVFSRAGLVAGPMFLRDLGFRAGEAGGTGHMGHKSAAIDRVMAANPGLPFVLIGDTGQADAHVYLEACRRHGGRVSAVVLRQPGPGPDAESRRALAMIRSMGVAVVTGTDLAHAPVDLNRARVRA